MAQVSEAVASAQELQEAGALRPGVVLEEVLLFVLLIMVLVVVRLELHLLVLEVFLPAVLVGKLWAVLPVRDPYLVEVVASVRRCGVSRGIVGSRRGDSSAGPGDSPDAESYGTSGDIRGAASRGGRVDGRARCGGRGGSTGGGSVGRTAERAPAAQVPIFPEEVV